MPPSLVTYRTTILVRFSKQFDQLIALALVERMWSTLELLEAYWFDAPPTCRVGTTIMLRRDFCNGGRRKKAGYRHPVMVTAKEQAEIRKAANKAALPMSVYVRAKALEPARAG